jgi:phospholipid/cholesterol/gamma-HCH transport system substrate-binding protein
MPSPRQIAWAKFRATVVTIVALVILSILLYLLTGGTLLKQRVTLNLYIPDATALTSESPVRVNGIDVGKVGLVALSGSNDPNRVIRVTLNVERDHLADIPTDSYAQITADTLIGDKFVDVSRGRESSTMQPGGELRYKALPDLMKTLDLEQFEEQLRQVDAMLTDIEQQRNRVGQFLLGEESYQKVRQWFAGFEHDFHELASPAGRAGKFIYTDEFYRKLQEPLRQFDDRLARIQAGEGTAGSWLRGDAQYMAIRDQLAGLERSVAQVRSNTWLQSDEMYDSWNRSIRSLIRQVDEVNTSPMVNSMALYESLTGSFKELRATVADFRQDPQKYLRIKLF